MNKILIDLKTENNFVFGQLYKDNFYKISRFVLNNNGNLSDAKDLFQDAMMVLVQKVRTDDFQLTASLNTYVYAICKNLWLKRLKNKNLSLSLDYVNDSTLQDSIDTSIENEKSYSERLKYYLAKITAHCNRFIHDIIFRNKTIEDIQFKYGYTTRHNAQNQKYKCIEQIKRIKAKEESLKK